MGSPGDEECTRDPVCRQCGATAEGVGLKKPAVIIVIPTWNGWENVNACLETVVRQTYEGELKVIVVDNGSTDGTAERMARTWQSVDCIRLQDNRGFTGACNRGINRALEMGCDYVVLVNNDTLLDRHMVDGLVEAGEANQDAALFNPLICYAGAPDIVWATGNFLSLFSAMGGGVDNGRRRADVEAEGLKQVDAATGCILMARSGVLREVGILSEKLFMYYEDADLSVRVRHAGYRILAVPKALAWHKISSDIRRNVDYSAFLYYYSIRNRLTLMAEHAHWYHWPVFVLRFSFWSAYKLSGLMVLGRHAKRRAIMDGIRDFVRQHYPARKYEPRG